MLLHKLPLLDGWNEHRRAAAAFYAEALDGIDGLRLPQTAPDSDPVWHLYVVRTPDRDALAAHLAARGIGTGLHYPQPVHLTPAYRHLGLPAGSLPGVGAVHGAHCLSLPIYPGITPVQLEEVAETVADFFTHGR